MVLDNTSYPVLSVVGTTAVGKTDLAFATAHELLLASPNAAVDIISADSRQVFQDLEILTGADIPAEFNRVHDTTVSDYDFFEHERIRLFGVSMLKPNQDWSVSQFQQFAQQLVKKAMTEQHYVLVVGGTGLFHKHLFNPDPRLHVAPNLEVRNRATEMSVEELQAWLLQLDPIFLEQMNDSDRHNPRRLVRAIEVAMADLQPVNPSVSPLNVQHFFLGLTLPIESLSEKIAQRVQVRLQTAKEEVAAVLKEYGSTLSPMSESILGFPQLKDLLAGTKSEKECIDQWTSTEIQYAKRQHTWWKARSDISWFLVDQPDQREAALTHAVTALRHGVTAINS